LVICVGAAVSTAVAGGQIQFGPEWTKTEPTMPTHHPTSSSRN